ncbi:Dynamin central domain [Artemisia annua]|uniref:Dynamin central domain n=1 Tax=Artemisia annua TaxID=35608 RepID=A0A2U1N580_ARTAN|nr:Dynamin central domain [Artemisia annua]
MMLFTNKNCKCLILFSFTVLQKEEPIYTSSDDEYSSVVDEGGSDTLDLHHQPPLISTYNDRIRPLLNCIDKLRHLKVMQEGIQLPTIVVVGDHNDVFMRIISSVKESLRKILIRGEFEEYPDVTADGQQNDSFLMEEIRVLEEAKGIGLPNFLPQTAFLICQLNL